MNKIKLLPEDKIIVNQCFEILNTMDVWGPHHSLGNGILVSDNPGKTLWLRPKFGPWRLTDINECVTLKNMLSKYQKILNPEIQEGITHNFGRVYIHRMQPGQEIGRHYDFNDQPYMSLLSRFHLYGNISDGNIIESVPPVEENCFMYFNHNEWHEYKNYSKDNLFFIVYDLIVKKNATRKHF